MTGDALLLLIILPLTAWAWICAYVLACAARRRPGIGTLTERAIVAFGIAAFGSIYSLVALNNETFRVWNTAAAIVVVRLAVIGLLALPVYWSWAYATGRLSK